MAVALLLYVLGLRFALVPILLVGNMLLLPMPAVLASWLSRLVLSFLVTMSLVQLGGALQFLLFPRSDFRALALITTAVNVLLVVLAPRPALPASTRIIDKRDCCGLLVAAMFVLPFSPILVGRNSATRIAEIGGLQAIDGPNHYAAIAGMIDEQHLDYAVGSYYPKGFHLATAFFLTTVLNQPSDLGWTGNAILYLLDYMAYGSLLAYLLFYLCLAWLMPLVRAGPRWLPVIAALSLGPPLAVVYLIPWVELGFLSYYYATLTIVASFLHLHELTRRGVVATSPMADVQGRWHLLLSLVLLYGAGMSWTLLLPPTVLIVMLFTLPASLSPIAFIKQFASRTALPVLVTLALLLLPIYFQLKYSPNGSTQSINISGGLHGFHALVLLIGAAILGLVLMNRRVDLDHKRMLVSVLLPLLAFVSLIVAEQFFAVGEVRYYAIKTAMFVEMLLLVLAVAVLLFSYLEGGGGALKYALLLPAVPATVIVLLISNVADPLQGTRDLFRGHSHSPKPAFFDNDVAQYVRLGQSGLLNQFNSTSLHYDQTKQKFYTHMQIPFWADMMEYQVTGGGFVALECISRVYDNIAFGTFSAQDQLTLIGLLDQCVAIAHQYSRQFYVVTDRASAPFVRRALGPDVQLAY